VIAREVFVDSSGWYAMIDADDRHHPAAVRQIRRLTQRRRLLISTNHVIGETYTLLRKRLGFRLAQAFLQYVRTDPSIQRMFVPEEWENEAERLLAQYGDQVFSYVDAVSFVTMRRLRIQEALAFDHDFLIAGFIPVSDE
jgi:uncharacterized protein